MALKPNKIEYGGNVLLDLTQDNVDAGALVEGYTAHNAAGEPVLGANPYEKTATDSEVNIQAQKIAQLSTILDGKAAGGGGGGGASVETCTVIIAVGDEDTWETVQGVYTVLYTQLTEAGLIIAGNVRSSDTLYQIDNAVCGTPITVHDESMSMYQIAGDDNMGIGTTGDLPFMKTFITPTVKGSVGTITL